jgi:hypothetical protein
MFKKDNYIYSINNNHLNNLESDSFKSQGIVIELPKKNITNIIIKLQQYSWNSKIYDLINYDNDLINIYGESLSDSLTYFSFNSIENLNTGNLNNSIDFSHLYINEINIEANKYAVIPHYINIYFICIYRRDKIVLSI